MSNKHIQLTDGLSLPLEIVTMRTAAYGDSGSGKTTFARLLGEKVHEAGQRFCAIDLKNDWWGFKSSADGSSAGLPVVIFGGPRGDVKLFDDAAAARSLAETVASIDQSVILDLDAMSRAKQERFLAVFLDALYEVNRRALLLFCDEADRYAPQKPMTQDAIMSLSSSEDIARRGRKRGIGSFWLTQRTAVLNKNVSEFCNLTVIFRTPGERDLKELEERVGRIANKETVKEVMRLAPGLADGQAFFLSSHPKLRKFMPDPVRPVQLPLPWTFDSSATPGIGQRRREPKVLAKTDLAAIEQRMASQVQRAKEEDPKLLKAELARVKGELEKATKKPAAAAAPTKVEVKRVEVKVITDAQIKRLESIFGKAEARATAFSGKLGPIVNPLMALLHDERAEIGKLLVAAKAVIGDPALQTTKNYAQNYAQRPAIVERSSIAPVIARPVQPRPASGAAKRQVSAPDVGERSVRDLAMGPDGLRTMPRGILTALAQHSEGLTRQQLLIHADYQPSGDISTFFAAASRDGWIVERQGKFLLTTDGAEALGEYEPLPVGNELRQRVLANEKYPKVQRALLRVLFDAHPNTMARSELLAVAGYKPSGDISTIIAKLTRIGWIEVVDRQLKAGATFFS